ncbi:Addiction module antidote protein, CC2985 family [Tumidithrix helvetica PCC 7403]|uniref:ribbon-helix-helix domain-containing protein n=1 Tax=Tumidithrix helvetica TaxID=3457545 RepID=UPI003C92430F
MQIALKQEQENFILEKLQQGKYQSVDELLAVAFRLLEEHESKERKLIELREKIAAGTQQIRQGKVVDGEIVFQQLQDKLNQIEHG